MLSIYLSSDSNEIWAHKHFVNKHSTISQTGPKNWAVLWVLICMVHLTVSDYHVTYVFPSESTLCRCLNAKELLAWNRRDIWSLSDSNGIQIHKHLVHKRTLNHLAKLAKNIELCCEYLSLWCIWLYVIMSPTRFSVNLHSIVSRMPWNSLFETGAISEVLVRKGTLNHLAKLAKKMKLFVSTYLYGAFDCMLSSDVLVSEWIYTL